LLFGSLAEHANVDDSPGIFGIDGNRILVSGFLAMVDAGRRHDGVTPPSQTPMDAEGVLQRKTQKIPPFCTEIPPTIALRYLLLRRDSSYVVDGGVHNVTCNFPPSSSRCRA
jgi:hypothetical protein